MTSNEEAEDSDTLSVSKVQKINYRFIRCFKIFARQKSNHDEITTCIELLTSLNFDLKNSAYFKLNHVLHNDIRKQTVPIE